MLADMSEPNLEPVKDSLESEEWLTASETIRQVRTGTMSIFAHETIAKRAHAGLLRARAAMLKAGQKVERNVEIPWEFWWAEGKDALTANWEVGDFETWINHQLRVQAFGVRFHAGDLREMLGTRPAETRLPAPVPSAGQPGRLPAEWWDDLWIEMCRALYVGDLKPQKQADIEKAMNDWIASKGGSAATSTVRSRARKLWQALGREGEK
jgi:hypothetical protein